MCVAAADEGASAACLQRMNTSASDEAPQDSRRRGIGSFSLRTCACAAAAPPATAKLLRHAPSGSCPAAPGVWTLARRFGHRALSTPSLSSSRSSCQRASGVCGQQRLRCFSQRTDSRSCQFPAIWRAWRPRPTVWKPSNWRRLPASVESRRSSATSSLRASRSDIV